MLRSVESGNRQNQPKGGTLPAVSSLPGRHAAQPESRLARLQAVHGNQGVQRLLRGGVLQRKLTINQPGDAFEQEADRVAEKVMRMPDPAANRAPVATSGMGARLQRCSCGKSAGTSTQCEECKTQAMQLQRSSAASSGDATAPPIVHEVLNSPGRPLDAVTRNFMEPRFRADFSNVRVHIDGKAAESATAVDALAYTVGKDIVFGAGSYQPQTDAGCKLLGHELAHSIQQNATTVQRQAAPRRHLQAPRFDGNAQLERALNNEELIQRGSTSEAVRLIQESLLAEGYNLPAFGADGIFGRETEALIKQFQTDAGAVKIDGIVGPETMGLLDDHDPSNMAGLGPVRKVGPVPGPRPAPAAGCDDRFNGVAFTLANQVAAPVAPAANIAIVLAGGRPFLRMRGTAPANYQPHVTIAAPSDARAQEFEVGFISNVLTTNRDANFPGGHRIHTQVPTPIKDGAPLASGDYDAIFVQVPAPAVRENFAANGATVNLNWPDTPGDGAFVNLPDNAACAAFPASAMTDMVMNDTFRTWVAVRHRRSGCVRTIHHIDWDLLWSATVNPGVPLPVATVTSNVINVTQTNGDGRPPFIQGGRVPGDIAVQNCV
jgi:peptidoglycan hydrolase-like protein with peptidoglycan-binding domain